MKKLPLAVGFAGMLLAILNPLPKLVFGQQPSIAFPTDIQPILQRHCYRCHGSVEQEAGLRLDRKAEAVTGGDSGPAWIAGDRHNSLLYQRVAGIGDFDQMPPDTEPLSQELIERIGKWIDQGGVWPDDTAANEIHWAYIAPARPELPAVKNTAWPKNEIDLFVLSRLESEAWEPSPPANRARLLRRVYLDLIGLPPTVEELDAFLSDPDPNAYERVVDQLLASPHYGERWAVPWLDGARYADSNGYQADQYREVWPYRDWVVDALNAGMPFDQFTIEQLAGDLLEDSTTAQKIATGFHRQTTCNVEAGVDPEENRVNQIFDRVNTTGTVWLGTTIECAQCHDHKYDPFDQRDYYGLFAYFNNTPLEVKHTTATTYDFIGPKLDVPLPENSTAEQRQLKQDFQTARDELDQYLDQLTRDQDQWEAQQRALIARATDEALPWRTAEVVDFVSTGGANHEILSDGSILVDGERPDKDTYLIRLSTDLPRITAIKLEALTHPSLPGNGPGRHHPERPNFVLNELELQLFSDGNESDEGESIPLHRAWADFSQKQYDVAGAIDGKPETGWAVHQEFHQPHVATFQTVDTLWLESSDQLQLVLTQNHGGCRNLGRIRVSLCADVPPESETVIDLPHPEIVSILEIAPTGRTEDQQDQVVEYYRNQQPEFHLLNQKVDSLKQQLGDAMSATTLVMVEMDDTRENSILKRGNFLTPGEKVRPGTPRVLPAAGKGNADRLELARWLVSRDNPLTASVTVNRWWAEVFGQGIVTTTEDFGTQGALPTHPRLLDWLAVEFMEDGWSMKQIHRLIVTSATYRQSSRITAEALDRDPQNRLLARGPRFRLGAESIRDNALRISGLLSATLGGPPVYPPQPEGVWRHVGRNPPKYQVETGDDRFRRGLYVVWRRSAPYPSFVNFDAPDRAACVVKRSRANTPLQALTLMNDEAYVEMAWAFAGRLAGKKGDVVDAIRFGFRCCFARQPTDDEIQMMLEVYQDELSRLQNEPDTARLMIGSQRLPPGATPPEFAAWFFVASILLNLDETITKG